MANVFQRVELTAPQYNWFDMNHPVLTSFDIGRLVPKAFKVYAGDRVKIGMEHLIRFQQMYAPVFQRFDVRFDACFYPDRLVWPEALDFYRGGNSGSTEYPYPRIYPCYIYGTVIYDYLFENNLSPTDLLQGNPLLHSLIDYFNMPTFDDTYNSMVDQGQNTYANFIDEVFLKLHSCPPVNILPFVMYQGLFRQWYRNKQVDVNNAEDQDWQYGTPEYWRNPVNWTEYLPDIPVYELIQLLPANFRGQQILTFTQFQNVLLGWNIQVQLIDAIHILRQIFMVRDVRFANDYFTSALPSPLMPEVQLPIGNIGAFDANGNFISDNFATGQTGVNSVVPGYSFLGVSSSPGVSNVNRAPVSLRPDVGTIQQLREASAMDQYLNRSALGGNGTGQDWLLAHYGVKTSDARLDMPQIINRVKSYVSISEVTQTSESTQGSSLGEFAGHGISINNHGLCDFFVEEPGMMFIMMSVVPKQAYFQGMPKLFTRHDRFDFPIPEFAKIGMEPVDKRELYYDIVGTGQGEVEFGEEVFGYQDRYAWDKTMLPEIHGDFRASLSSWHDSRMFSNQPALNSDFIKVDHTQGLDRIFNVLDFKENKLLALLQYKVSIERCLPVYPRYSL